MSKLIFFDIDGTLAIHRHIPPENREALKKLLKNGEKTFICSGRPPFYARQMFGDFTYGMICCNGGCICTKDEILYGKPLSLDQVGYLCRKAQQIGFGVLFADENCVYPYNMKETEIKMVQNMYGSDRVCLQFDPEKSPVYNFDFFYGSDENFELLSRIFDGILILNDHHGAGSADGSFIETNKGTAIEWLQKNLDISKANTYAFGDGVNDLAMFDAAGHRIAMENAVDELKKKATFITRAVDQGGIVYGLKQEGILKWSD